MIKGIAQIGRYTYVQGGNANLPYVSPNSNIPFTGVMRMNGTDVEVFNGSSWVMINSSYASVGLTPEAEALLDWAKQKRADELRIRAIAEKHAGIKDLQEKLDIMVALVKENDTA
jgi:hypothetical protein